MLKDAPIIILDEATSSVDPENEDELQRAIEALTHDKTIISAEKGVAAALFGCLLHLCVRGTGSSHADILPDTAVKQVSHLSGGERQRIAIARAMLKNAPVVILDEATAYIDPENEALVQKAISTLTVGHTSDNTPLHLVFRADMRLPHIPVEGAGFQQFLIGAESHFHFNCRQDPDCDRTPAVYHCWRR